MYAVIDTRTMTAEIAGAGHPAAIVADLNDPESIERVESEGALLGVFPDAEFESARVSLAGGKSLVMFTDGFETAFPDAEAGAGNLKMPTDVYIGRLAGLARNAGASADLADALKAFEGDLDMQMGSLHRPDDVTALVVAPDLEAGAAGSSGVNAAA